jgi:hypothetical protein
MCTIDRNYQGLYLLIQKFLVQRPFGPKTLSSKTLWSNEQLSPKPFGTMT